VPPISIKAIVIAFAAEICADIFLSLFVFSLFAFGTASPNMGAEDFEKVRQMVFEDTLYLPVMFLSGSATTVLGAYLAARIAKRIPYYHGLAIGIVGLVYCLALWPPEPTWLDFLGLVCTIPFSLYGAHLARKHMPLEN
jgi:hypothetical protein